MTTFSLDTETAGMWKVHKIKLNVPFSVDELHKEFEHETWDNPSMHNNLGNDNWSGWRFYCTTPGAQSPTMQSILNYMRSDQVKNQIINLFYSTDPAFEYDWEWTPEEMSQHTQIGVYFIKDMPGFVNVLHTDYRKLVGTAMVYWTAEDDNPDISTVFYDSKDRTNPVRMPTNFGQGWLHANGNQTYHEGWNKTDQVRYSMLFGLTLNVTPIAP